MQQAGLGAGVRVDLECFFVLPGNMQTTRTLHHSHGAVGLAGVAFGDVFVGVPAVGDAARIGIEGQIGMSPFCGTTRKRHSSTICETQ